MNTIVQNEFDILHETTNIRHELFGILTDADLAYKLPGNNPSLGAICREIGQVEQSYTASFKTLKQDFIYAPAAPALETSVQALKDWFAQLDAELEAALSALTEEQVQSATIDRGWQVPILTQFHIYREALLIFYAKAVCYLHALGKPLPEQMRVWIG